MLVRMVVLIAGCLPSAAPDLPVSFTEHLRDEGQVFTAMPASSAEESLDAMVRRISAGYAARTHRDSVPLGRAVPVYGVLTCLSGGPM